MIKKPIRILFDWGGTICNDCLLFEYFAKNSGNNIFDLNNKDYVFRPEYWDRIKSIGSENFFSKNQEKVFDIAELYCDSIRTVNKFYATEGMLSLYENFIVYDCKPEFDFSQDKSQLLFAKTILKKGLKINGIYLSSDKVSLAKNIGIDYVVDDDPRIILALASANVKSILISRLWNRPFSIQNVSFYIPSKKRIAILKNIFIAEDFSDVERIIKNNQTK